MLTLAFTARVGAAALFVSILSSLAVSAPATPKDRSEVEIKMVAGGLAAMNRNFETAKRLCSEAKLIASRFEPDDMMLGFAEYCTATVEMGGASECPALRSAHNHFRRAAGAGIEKAREYFNDISEALVRSRC